MKKISELISLFDSYKKLGTCKTKNKSLLIGRPYEEKPYWWLIKFFAPASKKHIKELEESIKIPDVYKEFLLKYANGLNYFLGTFSLDGYRTNYKRILEEAIQQPFDILTPNTYERPRNAKPEYFFIGSYRWDGSQLYINTLDNHVYFCGRYDATPLKEWNSFEEMLVSETKRILTLFNENGEKIDEAQSTLPV